MVMLGHNDIDNMASGSLAMQLYLVVFMIGEGIVFGFGPLYGRFIDNDDIKGQKSAILSCTILLLAFSFISILAMSYGVDLLILFQQAEELANNASAYLLLLGLSVFPNLAFILLWEVLAFRELEKYVLVGAFTQFSLNIVFNYVFIYGAFGVPPFGLVGAGISTVLASTCGALTMYFLLKRHSDIELFNFGSLKDQITENVKEILRVGLPFGLTLVGTVGFLTASYYLMGTISENALVSHTAIMSINEIIVVFALGFGEFAVIQLSSNRSSLNFDVVNRLVYKISVSSLTIILVVIIPLLLLNSYIAPLFFGTSHGENLDELVNLVIMFSYIALPFLLVNGLIIIFQGVFRGFGQTKIPLILTLCGYWIVGFMCQLCLVNNSDNPIVIWIGMQIGFCCTLVLLLFYYFTYFRKQVRF